jgi:hypothetical protein
MKIPLNPPFAKGGKRGILRYAPCSLLYAISDCSDFLPHKDEITDSKAEKRDSHQRNQKWQDDIEALEKSERILKTR